MFHIQHHLTSSNNQEDVSLYQFSQALNGKMQQLTYPEFHFETVTKVDSLTGEQRSESITKIFKVA